MNKAPVKNGMSLVEVIIAMMISITYRGSLLCLYEPEVYTAPYHSGYATPPKRQFGLNELFSKEFRFPPGTPTFQFFLRGKCEKVENS